MDVDTAVSVILGSIASQYKVSLENLQAWKIAKVVEEEVKALLEQNGGEFSAKDFPFDKIIADDELRPELLEPAEPSEPAA
jgi:hypothetical protein